MNSEVDPVARSRELSRKFASAAITGAEEVSSLQLRLSQSVIARGTKQLRESLAAISQITGPENWLDALSRLNGVATTCLRDLTVVQLEFQAELFRLLEKNAPEAQQLLSGLIAEQFAAIGAEAGTAPKARPRIVSQKLAA